MAKNKNELTEQIASTALVVYVPVLHQGYLELFDKYPQAEIVVVDKALLEGEFRSIQKDIRALETEQMMCLLKTLLPERQVVHLQKSAQLEKYTELIFPEDEISQWLESKLVSEQAKQKIIHDTIFLRWSEAKVKQKQDLAPDKMVTSQEFQQEVMEELAAETKKSSDWWRQIAAAIFQDGELIAMAHNTHKPLDQNPYIFGDPRANSSRGLAIEVSTAMHAEQVVIAAAAKQGISLKNADLYVTTFPCPYCARLVAYSGIKRVFYEEGYSVLDGAEIMRGQGLEVVRVMV